jgi:predicted ATPase
LSKIPGNVFGSPTYTAYPARSCSTGHPEVARAEACFIKAMEIARSQEARLLELRAATDLARLWRDIGSPNDPRALLAPILAAIEGGETTRDVRNARALLEDIV